MLCNLPNTLTHLYLNGCDSLHGNISYLPLSLQSIIFINTDSYKFKRFEYLPVNLNILMMDNFDDSIIKYNIIDNMKIGMNNLPIYLDKLHIGYTNTRIIYNKYKYINMYSVHNLPKMITSLTLYDSKYLDLNNLPDSIEKLDIFLHHGCIYPLRKFPSKLKHLNLFDYNYLLL